MCCNKTEAGVKKFGGRRSDLTFRLPDYCGQLLSANKISYIDHTRVVFAQTNSNSNDLSTTFIKQVLNYYSNILQLPFVKRISMAAIPIG